MYDYIRLTKPNTEQDPTKIAAKIGEAYKQWNPMDIISISSPTGSGKTYFILHVLLEWVINEFLHNHVLHQIIYFVNRKILKKQLEDELSYEIQRILDQQPRRLHYSDYIRIFTYQEVQENVKIKGRSDGCAYLPCPNHFGEKKSILDNYAFVIYDECHYFLSDSVFNPETQLAFEFLTRKYDMEIQVFMSATIDDIGEYLNERYCKDSMTVPNVMGAPFIDAIDLPIPFATGIRVSHKALWKMRKYSIEADYKYINLKSITDKDEVQYLVSNQGIKGKWLVFVDDKGYGDALCKEFNQGPLKGDVIFLDAEYEDSEDTLNGVDEIVSEKASSKRVVICTSVIDNGVTFFDEELRNIVVMTDMKDEFLQMLGRKRFDVSSVDLYICQRSKSFFSNRLRSVKTTRGILEQNINNSGVSFKNSPERFQSNFRVKQQLLNSILKSRYQYQNIKRFCYAFEGNICISDFSLSRLAKMEAFYSDMEKELGKNADAFLEAQASWLGKSLDEVERLHIKSTFEWKKERIDKVVSELEKDAEVKLNIAGNQSLRKRIRKPLQELLKEAKDYKEKMGKSADEEKKTIGKDTISVETFSRIAKYFDLPFTMEKPDGSHFIIHRVDDPNLTPTADSDLRELRKGKKKTFKKKS